MSVTFLYQIQEVTKYIGAPYYNSKLPLFVSKRKGGVIVKREHVKTILIQVVGAIAAVCCPVYGYYPIAMAFFAAAYRCVATRWVLLPVMTGAFFVKVGFESTVKYGVCMAASAVIYELIIHIRKELRGIWASLVMAGVLWLVEAAGGFIIAGAGWYVVLGGLEALVVIGLETVLYMAISSGTIVNTLAYFVCLWILAIVYVPFVLETEQLKGLIVAAALFLLFPIQTAIDYSQSLNATTDVERIKYGSNRILETAMAFRRLADSIRRINKADDGIFAAEVQLKAAAGTLEEISSSMLAGDYNKEHEVMREAVLKAFFQRGYIVKRLNIKKGIKDEIIVQATMKTKGNIETSKEAAQIISNVHKKGFKPAEGCRTIINGDYAGYTFVEVPEFMMLYGSAAMTKNGEEVSGDNFTFTELGTGEVLLGIVDGMGSGVAAGEDSEIVIELLEELLKAGFDEEASLALVNSVLLTRKEEQSLTAIDMAVGDLYTGRFNFIKLGAAATFIKRNRWVEILKSTTYPIGILKKVDYESTVKKLYDGDYIVMVSDGILDAVARGEKEELLSEWIAEYDKKNPKEFARYILNKAIDETGGRANDDMTVLVAGIWTKHT